MTDIPLDSLPQSLLPIKTEDWKNACDWIRARWGRTNWDDDTILFEDARFWLKEELDGGLQYALQKGGDFPPTFAELSRLVKEWRTLHLEDRLGTYNKKLPPERGSLADYLLSIKAESFAHACYLKVQERAKKGALEVYEDPNAFNKWTMDWNEAKASYMTSSQSLGKSESMSQDKNWDEIVAP